MEHVFLDVDTWDAALEILELNKDAPRKMLIRRSKSKKGHLVLVAAKDGFAEETIFPEEKLDQVRKILADMIKNEGFHWMRKAYNPFSIDGKNILVLMWDNINKFERIYWLKYKSCKDVVPVIEWAHQFGD